MEIADRASYTLAVITSDLVLSVSSLKERVQAIDAQLSENGVRRGDKVVMFVTDATWQLPVLWALLKKDIIAVLVDKIRSSQDLTAIAHQANARYIITEKNYSTFSESINIVAVDEVNEQYATENSSRFNFYNGLEYQSACFMNDASLAEYFGVLDAAITPSANDIIMLGNIPYEQQVMEMLWASLRGIPVVVEPRGDYSLSRYMQSDDRFPMAFSLFHFGSYVESSDANKYGQLFDTVRFADKNGFTAVWTPERHFNEFGGLFPNPSVLSAAIAVSTSRVQIRCGSIVAPLHHPVRIAEDWSLIDNLSNGRAAISFASGWQCDDFIFFPDNYAQRHDCMMNNLDTVKRLWTGEKLPFKNGLGREVNIAIFPKPIQQDLPVWITVSARTETFIDAGKAGVNILTHLLWQDSDELIDKIAAYRKSLSDNGFDPRSRTVSVMVHTYLGSDNETVKNKVREPLKNYIRTSTQLIQAMVKSNVESTNAKDIAGRYGGLNDEVPAHLMDELVEIAFNRFFEQAALLGSLEKAATLLKKLKGYDVDEIAALIDFGLGRDDIMAGLIYLNKLREMYDKETMTTYPVTIMHCSARELEDLQNKEEGAAFINAQSMLLLEADDETTIPENILQKTHIVRFTNQPGQEPAIHVSRPTIKAFNKESVFMAAISSDFD